MFCTINPVSGVELLRRNLDALFNSSLDSQTRYDYPLLNAYESADAVTVIAEIPGVAKPDLSITYENGVLSLSGKRKIHTASSGASVLRKERSGETFEKVLKVPVKINDTAITATLTDGILTVVLPKSEDVKPKTIAIN